MYCGSCLRDNALAAELMARGHDVSLLPVYTPTRTDEPNVSDERVFFGGVSVYLQQHVPLFRHTPDFLDRLWDSARRHPRGVGPRRLDRSEAAGRADGLDAEGRGRLPGQGDAQAAATGCATQPPYDVVNLPNALLLGLAPRAAPRAGSVRSSARCRARTCSWTALHEPYRRQSMALIRGRRRAVDAFVAVSAYYADFMAGYLGLPAERVHTVPLGITLRRATRRASGARRGPFTIGYFARVAPEKGLHLLAEAYVRLRREHGLTGVRALEVAGYLAPEHRRYLAQIEADLRGGGLGGRVPVPRARSTATGKIAFLRELDVLSVPSPYVEPKGLYLLEAMANGVPVVQPRHGAFPEILRGDGRRPAVRAGRRGRPRARSCWSSRAIRAQAARLGRAGAEGVRRHYGRRRAWRTRRCDCTRRSHGRRQLDRPRSPDARRPEWLTACVATDVRKEYPGPDAAPLTDPGRRLARRSRPASRSA